MKLPRSDDEDDDWLALYGGISMGSVSGHDIELTDTQKRVERKKLAEALAKKRPLGFAPWPDDAE